MPWRRHVTTSLALISLLSAVHLTRAQTVRFEHITVNDGLSDNEVRW
ncbi:MAG: hypothetical protein WBW88_19360 [Rhodothermales bacterium]